jgi:hypothetical protein
MVREGLRKRVRCGLGALYTVPNVAVEEVSEEHGADRGGDRNDDNILFG